MSSSKKKHKSNGAEATFTELLQIGRWGDYISDSHELDIGVPIPVMHRCMDHVANNRNIQSIAAHFGDCCAAWRTSSSLQAPANFECTYSYSYYQWPGDTGRCHGTSRRAHSKREGLTGNCPVRTGLNLKSMFSGLGLESLALQVRLLVTLSRDYQSIVKRDKIGKIWGKIGPGHAYYDRRDRALEHSRSALPGVGLCGCTAWYRSATCCMSACTPEAVVKGDVGPKMFERALGEVSIYAMIRQYE
ncbi:hypothetical protein C8Q72DRAFT_794497 [Fomitopsis betulina]|nr:hypothetical protein C8Q72DRAFT_794497 [Fomitopsis betulina]